MELKALNKLFACGREVIFRAVGDARFTVTDITESVAVFGYTADDFTSGKLGWKDIIHPDDRNRLIDCTCYKCNTQNEYRILTKSGDVVTVVCSCAADDDDENCFWVHVRDTQNEKHIYEIGMKSMNYSKLSQIYI